MKMRNILSFLISVLTMTFLLGCEKVQKEQDLIITDIAGMYTATDAVAPSMMIRVNKSLTYKFNPAGKTMNQFRLTKNAIHGDPFYSYLEDVNFKSMIPIWNPPAQFITVKDTVIDENGNWIIGNVQIENPDWDPMYAANFATARNELQSWMQNNLEIQELKWFPKIPSGVNVIWESVDMTKPYRDRYMKMTESEKQALSGITNGQAWVGSFNFIVYERFAYWTCQYTSPQKGMNWIAYGLLAYY